MNSRKVAVWALCGAATLAVAGAGVLLARKLAAPQLPGEARYASLPAAFNQALDAQRDRVRRGDYAADDLRALARLFQANRLYNEAGACYQIIAKRSGLDAHDHYYLAAMAQFHEDLDGAEKELRAVLSTEPRYMAAHVALGNVLFKNGRTDEAQKEYTETLSIEANQPQAMYGLARIDLMNGNDEASISRLQALLMSHPEMTSGAGLLSQIYDRRGDAKGALAMRQWSRQRPEPEPDDPWMDSLMGDCYDSVLLGLKFEEYFATGQIQLAVPFLSRIEELDPKSPVPQLLRGWVQSMNHHEQEAVDEYRRALEKGADPEKICPYMVKSLVALRKTDEAERLISGYYAKKPDSIPILEAYADVAVLQGESKVARVLLAKVLEKEPYLNSANLNMAKILWSSGERDDAVIYLQRLADMNPSDVASRALLGQYYLGKADPDSAMGPLEQAVAIESPQSSRYKSLTSMLYAAYLQAGNRLAQQGHGEDAVAKFYDKAIKLEPDEAPAYAGKAVVCAQLKQFPGAAEALEKMATLQPRNPTIYLSLGDVLYEEGDPAQARRNWQRALDLSSEADAELRNAIGTRLSGNITAETFR